MNWRILASGFVLLLLFVTAPLLTTLTREAAPPVGAPNASAASQQGFETNPPAPAIQTAADGQVVEAYRNHQSNVQVTGGAVVSRLLPDDNEGSRHQKFILQLSSGKTLLIAHNIDLAPRIGNIREGDFVEFCGEYEWNEKGGVVHWTHHDPARRHVGGWLQHNGRTYQ
jgi:hypothetical protein